MVRVRILGAELFVRYAVDSIYASTRLGAFLVATSPAAVIIMAAGKGTRMRSATPKVLHQIGGAAC